MGDNSSAGIEPNVSRSELYLKFGKALRDFVGRGCRYSYKRLERKSGVCARMIEAYRLEPCDPEWRAAPFEDIISLSGALGPSFTAQWLAMADQGAFWLPQPGETPPAVLAADAAEDTAIVARAAADGNFDDGERPDLRVVGRNMIERGMRLAAA